VLDYLVLQFEDVYKQLTALRKQFAVQKQQLASQQQQLRAILNASGAKHQ
jgi:hypothetical protein